MARAKKSKIVGIKIRVGSQLIDRLKEAAKVNNDRSFNVEIVNRLAQSFADEHNMATQEDIISDLRKELNAAENLIGYLKDEQAETMEQACLNALAKVGLKPKDAKS